MPKIKLNNNNDNISTVTPSILPLIKPAPVPSSQSINPVSSRIDEVFEFPSRHLNEEDKLLFNDSPYTLTLSLRELLSPAKKNRRDKNYPQKIPRPQNAWVLFRKDYEASQRVKFPDKTLKMKNVSTEAGEAWKGQPEESKRYFEILSKLAQKLHKIVYPNYKYNPKKKFIRESGSTSKDWIFRDSSVCNNNNNSDSNNNDDDDSETTTTSENQIVATTHDPSLQQQQNLSPPHISPSLSSSPESWASSSINSPKSPSTNFVSPMITQNDGLFYSTVTSILTYSEETLKASSYYNYQKNVAVSNDNSFVSNLNDLNLTKSDYETYMNLANTCTTNDTIFINDDDINIVDWQFSNYNNNNNNHNEFNELNSENYINENFWEFSTNYNNNEYNELNSENYINENFWKFPSTNSDYNNNNNNNNNENYINENFWKFSNYDNNNGFDSENSMNLQEQQYNPMVVPAVVTNNKSSTPLIDFSMDDAIVMRDLSCYENDNDGDNFFETYDTFSK